MRPNGHYLLHGYPSNIRRILTHTNLGFPLALKILERLHQMDYLNLLYEESAVINEILDLPIGNVLRIL